MNLIDQLRTKLDELTRQSRAIEHAIQVLVGAEPAKPKPEPRPAKLERQARSGNGQIKKPAVRRGENDKFLPTVAKLREPFSAGDLRDALKVEHKAASNLIIRWTAKGWLKRLDFGTYQRTPAFPTDTSNVLSDLRNQIRGEVDADLAKRDPNRNYA
jgi:hypothetical protein